MHGIMKPIQPCPVSLLPIASQELIGKCIWQRLHGQQACATCGLSKLGTRPAHMRFVWYFFGGGRVLVANTVKDVLLVCCLMRQGSAAPFQERAPVKPLNPGAKKTSFESLFAETVVFKISLTFGPQNPEKCRCWMVWSPQNMGFMKETWVLIIKTREWMSPSRSKPRSAGTNELWCASSQSCLLLLQ